MWHVKLRRNRSSQWGSWGKQATYNYNQWCIQFTNQNPVTSVEILYSYSWCHIYFIFYQDLCFSTVCSNPIIYGAGGVQMFAVKILPNICSKPWLLFHKPCLYFPLESLDVSLILKLNGFLFSDSSAQISATDCADCVAALNPQTLFRNTHLC